MLENNKIHNPISAEMKKRMTIAKFIEKSNKIHQNKYDYSKVIYKNNKTPVCIICPEHGEFWQTPDKHLSGCGCPACSGTKRGTTESFIEKARKIHGKKYDYGQIDYINNKTPVRIICPEHGEFWQTPHNHLKGRGCPECAKTITKPKKYNTEAFILAAKRIHGINKYDYSKTDYKDMNTNVCIICPEHGEFRQTPYLHLNGSGCPYCARIKNAVKKRLTADEFVKRSNTIHGFKYDYSKINYTTIKRKVCIICPEHGEFWQTPDKHLSGCGCPKCVYPFSKAENEIADYSSNLLQGNEIIRNDRNILDGKELDIFIPSLNIGIEYNGLYWHMGKDKNYHLKKLEACKEKGIKLIQVFEDEYVSHKDIVFAKLSHLLKSDGNKPKIMGRKCTVANIDKHMARRFLEKYHIQGFAGSGVYLGAYHNDELVAVMSFKQEHSRSNDWELTRFASNYNYVCQGVGGKLFKYFVKHYCPEKIKSFADRRWTINENSNIYTQMGFSFEKYTEPEYRYFKSSDGIVRQHKFGFRKNILHKKYGLPLNMTETEMTEKLGYGKIYDCGLIKYVWLKKESTLV